jgi:hypothetical protein
MRELNSSECREVGGAGAAVAPAPSTQRPIRRRPLPRVPVWERILFAGGRPVLPFRKP